MYEYVCIHYVCTHVYLHTQIHNLWPLITKFKVCMYKFIIKHKNMYHVCTCVYILCVYLKSVCMNVYIHTEDVYRHALVYTCCVNTEGMCM